MESLDKQYADVIAPLKENLAPKKFGLKYVQKLTKRSVSAYTVPDEVNFKSSFTFLDSFGSANSFNSTYVIVFSAWHLVKFHEKNA